MENSVADELINLEKSLESCFITGFGFTEDEYIYILFDNGAKLILESYILEED